MLGPLFYDALDDALALMAMIRRIQVFRALRCNLCAFDGHSMNIYLGYRF